MTKSTLGWSVFIAALGMMCGLMAPEIAKLVTWGEVYRPAFVAVIMAHFSVVALAFIGGKLIPESRDSNMRSRHTDERSE